MADAPANEAPYRLLVDVEFGENVVVQPFTNLYGCRIGTGRHYPTPPHLSPAYTFLGKPRGSFPVAEALAHEALSLPIYPGLREKQIEHVVESIREFFGSG